MSSDTVATGPARPGDAPRIGLALSGGGSRAAAFHLGCLRALHDHELLGAVRVVSGISGGALLAALWAYGPLEFAAFDAHVNAVLRRGLSGPILRRALAPTSLLRGAASTTRALLAQSPEQPVRIWNRTEAFAQFLDNDLFDSTELSDPTHAGLDVVLSATDLRCGAAVRFGSAASGCSRYGRILEPVTVGTAVAASAAYPVMLPTLERRLTFQRGDTTQRQTVLLSDGGLMDNLGLSVLTPGRSAAHTAHVYDIDVIISCDAGRGPLALRSPRFLVGRNIRAFEVTHAQAQNNGRGRLHEWARAGTIAGFVMAYLGMRDENLPVPVPDLVPRHAVNQYPTNFDAMSGADLETLSIRGEQLIRTLLPYYTPWLC